MAGVHECPYCHYRFEDAESLRRHREEGGGCPEQTACDHCGQLVHQDSNGWWVGQDDTSDCPTSERGHEVEGSPR